MNRNPKEKKKQKTYDIEFINFTNQPTQTTDFVVSSINNSFQLTLGMMKSTLRNSGNIDF